MSATIYKGYTSSEIHQVLKRYQSARLTQIALAGFFILMSLPSRAEAVPAFARKYDLTCTVCHTKPPRLNPFGEAFSFNGFQIPKTEEGEVRKKRKVGRVFLEKEIGNIFAVRILGNFAEGFSRSDQQEGHLSFPHELELFIAGTLTQEISYFIEMQAESPKLEGSELEAETELKGEDKDNAPPDKTLANGLSDSAFEEQTGSGLELGRAFLVFNLGSYIKITRGSDSLDFPVVSGPMMRIGRIDPSTFFSFPFERQFFKSVPGRVIHKKIRIFSLNPYAIASKFFGMKTASGIPIEVTKPVLYNGESYGLDFHVRVGRYLLQAGMMQGIEDDPRDINIKKDPYLMFRADIGGAGYTSGSLSAFANWGNDTAMVGQDLVDWFRYGLGANIRIEHLDVYGAYILDHIRDLPDATRAVFDDTASGLSIEADYLITNQLMLQARYDHLDAGGFIKKKDNGSVLHFQARYSIRDNLAVFFRDSYNLRGLSSNPLRGFRNYVAIGADFDW